MGGGDKSTETITQPSKFDIQKAQTSELMNAFMMSNLQQGLQGQSNTIDESSTQNIINQLRERAGRYGASTTTPQFQQIQQNMSEGLTMPKTDMMNLAMSLYGQAQPSTTQGDTQSTRYDPSGNWPALWKGIFTG